MYNNILFPVDGSIHSKRAIEHVKKMAKVFSSDVTVLCVFNRPYSLSNSFINLPTEIYEAYKKNNEAEAKKLVDSFVSELAMINIDVTPLILEGSPKKIISEQAKKMDIDLIIMGTKGHAEANYMGSTSTYVINHTTGIPVMVV
jgi:nucleotide-binding universal stress UspA family protein